MTEASWPVQADQPLRTLARNIGTRYLFVVAEMLVGLLTLPFNLKQVSTYYNSTAYQKKTLILLF